MKQRGKWGSERVKQGLEFMGCFQKTSRVPHLHVMEAYIAKKLKFTSPR